MENVDGGVGHWDLCEQILWLRGEAGDPQVNT